MTATSTMSTPVSQQTSMDNFINGPPISAQTIEDIQPPPMSEQPKQVAMSPLPIQETIYSQSPEPCE
jgi:hypothetical protein